MVFSCNFLRMIYRIILKMMKLWTQCFAEKAVPKENITTTAVPSNNTNPPDAYVETNSKDKHLDEHTDDLSDEISVNELPTEILLLIFERLDKISLFYCFFVCKRWKSIVINIANREKTHLTWYFLCRQYQIDAQCQHNCDSKCLFPFQEMIECSLKWNYKYLISLSVCVPVLNAIHMTIYRDNIIVVTSQGVKYFDKVTLRLKKTIIMYKCNHFIENDYMVARSIKYENDEGYRLQLVGKSSFDDMQWVSILGLAQDSTTEHIDVRLFKIADNRCFVILNTSNTLKSYTWKYEETPKKWSKRLRCHYYDDEIITMDLGLQKIFLLTISGDLLCSQLDRDGDFEKVYTYSGFMQSRFVQLVHKTNLVLSLPEEYPCRIMRLIQGGNTTLYKLEIPKLTCVTENGMVLFLGFSDGKVKIIRPSNVSRENMVQHVIDLAVYKKDLPGPVVSIVVHVDKGKQSLLVATSSCVYRLIPTFQNVENIWEKENLVNLAYIPRPDLVSI